MLPFTDLSLEQISVLTLGYELIREFLATCVVSLFESCSAKTSDSTSSLRASKEPACSGEVSKLECGSDLACTLHGRWGPQTRPTSSCTTHRSPESRVGATGTTLPSLNSPANGGREQLPGRSAINSGAVRNRARAGFACAPFGRTSELSTV